MLKSRIIPFLLIHKGALYKTVNFKNPKYIGDPINAVRIFNEMEVDELVLLDIDSSQNKTGINYGLIEKLAKECRMPLCYGGGIRNIHQINKIITLGVEKVSISSGLILNPNLVKEAVRDVGSQSIVGVIDVKKVGILNQKYKVFINNGKKSTDLEPKRLAIELENLGVGELVINSIDKDGTLDGYDYELIDSIFNSVNIPITILGGAKSYSELALANKKYEIIGLGGGSIFVLHGKYRAVLISYPDYLEKSKILFYK